MNYPVFSHHNPMTYTANSYHNVLVRSHSGSNLKPLHEIFIFWQWSQWKSSIDRIVPMLSSKSDFVQGGLRWLITFDNWYNYFWQFSIVLDGLHLEELNIQSGISQCTFWNTIWDNWQLLLWFYFCCFVVYESFMNLGEV